jgi:hypothetical protein
MNRPLSADERAAARARRDERARARDADMAARRATRALQRRLRAVRPFCQHLEASGCYTSATMTWHVTQDAGERARQNLTFEQRQSLVAALNELSNLTRAQARGRDVYAAMLQGPVN